MHNCTYCIARQRGLCRRGMQKYHGEIQSVHHIYDITQRSRKHYKSNSSGAKVRKLKCADGCGLSCCHIFHFQLHSNVHLLHIAIVVPL